MQWTKDQVDRLYQAVGQQIRAARTRNGATQADLAKRIDLTRSSIANIEAGRQRVTLHLLFQIAEELQVLPSSFLVESDLPIPSEENLVSEKLNGQPDTTPDFVNVALRRAAAE